MNEENININELCNSLKCSGCTILSLIIIESGIINDTINKNSVCNQMLAVLNITHTDSNIQNVSSRINSMYSHLNAAYIFPLCIYKNNILNSVESTGNINRNINNNIWLDMSVYNLVIGLDNIKQNIPRQNYYISEDVISIFQEICCSYNMELIYFSNWNNDFENNINSLIIRLEKKYNINIKILNKPDFSLTKIQQQKFKQNGILDNF